jgi:hypothetical protein
MSHESVRRENSVKIIIVNLFDHIHRFNATLNNISVISYWSVLLVEETEVPEENQGTAAIH